MTMHLWKTVSNDDLFRRERFAITVHKERYLLVAGGFNEVEWRNSAVILDLQTGKSTKLPDLPPLCDYSSGVVLQGCFYVVGGRQNIFRIDLSTRKQWEKMNVLQHEHSLLSDGSNLYVLNENLSVMFNPETKKMGFSTSNETQENELCNCYNWKQNIYDGRCRF